MRTMNKTLRTPTSKEVQREAKQGETLKWDRSLHVRHHEHKLCCHGTTKEMHQGKEMKENKIQKLDNLL